MTYGLAVILVFNKSTFLRGSRVRGDSEVDSGVTGDSLVCRVHVRR